MISRPLFLTTMLGAAVALPYVMSSEFRGQHPAREAAASAGSESLGGGVPSAAAHGDPLASLTGARGGAPGEPSLPAIGRMSDKAGLAGAGGTAAGSTAGHDPNMAIEDVINFNVTPAWVMSHWPRVSASLAELDYQGYRVPLMSGAALDDLAGSLSYYFDRSQHVAKIHFQGVTGDPRRLVQVVTRQFGLRPAPSSEPGTLMYAVKWNNQVYSEMRIRTASVIRANDSRANYEVELKLTRF